MEASSQYNFKLVDFHISRAGYFLKVAMLVSSSSSYRLVYIPYSKYPSVLMLEYLISSMKELPSELNDALMQAINQELAAEVGVVLFANEPNPIDNAVQIDLIDSGRVYGFGGEVINEPTESARLDPHEAEMGEAAGATSPDRYGQFQDSLKDAFRSIDQPTRVFREVHLSKNVTRDLDKLRLNELAYRIKDQQLFIDLADSAKRIQTSDLNVEQAGEGQRVNDSEAVIQREVQALRDRIAELLVPKSTIHASRINTAKMIVPWLANQAQRVSDINPTFIAQENSWGLIPERYLRGIIGRGLLASRDIVSGAWITSENIQGNRKITTSARVGAHLAAIRGVDRDTVVRKTIESMKVISHPLFIDKSITKAKLKARQYPSHLIFMMQALRDRDWSMYVQEQIVGSRHIASPLYIPQSSISAGRDITHQTRVFRSLIDGERVVKKYVPKHLPSHVLREIMWGRRRNDVDAYIERNFSTAVRDNETGAWVVRDQIDSKAKVDRDLFIDRERQEGGRSKERMIYVPKNALDGSSRRSKKSHLSWGVQAARMESKEMYLEYVKQAERGNEQSTHLQESIGSEKKPKDSIIDELFEGDNLPFFALMEDGMVGHKPSLGAYLGEDWLGEKQLVELLGLLEEATLTAEVVKTHEGLYDEMMGALKLNTGAGGLLIEEIFLAHVIREMPAYILEVIYGLKEKPSELMDEILVGIRDGLNPSLMQMYDILAGKQSTFGGFIEQFIVGAKARLEALIESGIVGFQEARPSILTFGLESSNKKLGKGTISQELLLAQEEAKPSIILYDEPLAYEEAKPSVIPEELVGHEEAKPSVIPEGMTAHEEAKPSVIPVGIVAHEEAKPSVVEQGTFAHEEAKPSHMGEDVLADDVFRPSILQIENPFGYFEPDESFIPEGSEAFKPTHHLAQIGEEAVGQKPERPSAVGSGIEADPVGRGTEMADNPLAYREEKPSFVGEDYEALLKQRIAELSTEFVFGVGGGERAGHITDVYLLGEAGVRDGLIPEEEWGNYAKLALEQAIIAEGMFATNPEKAAQLVESILAFKGFERESELDAFDPVGERPPGKDGYLEEEMMADRDLEAGFIGESMLAQPNQNPAFIDADFIGEKITDAAQIIESILGDKELAEAVVLDYMLAAKRLQHDAYMGESMTATEQLKKAFLERVTEMGQGLAFDYRDEIIDEGMNPEDWQGGFSVPEEYDPHDPFNDYFPWTEERDQLMLGQDDWVRFDSEPQTVWHRDRNLGEFYCDNENPGMTGFYRNDFKHADYVFEVSFKVNDTAGDDGAGIMFRYTDPQNYYMFMINGGDPDGTLGMVRPMQLYRVRGGQTSTMASPMNSFTWTPGKWYQLQVSVIGNRIKLLVNGRLQYDFTD